MSNYFNFQPFRESVLFFIRIAAACTALCVFLERIYPYLSYCYSGFMVFSIPVTISLTHAIVYYLYGYFLNFAYEADYFPNKKVTRPRFVAKQTINWSPTEIFKGEIIGIFMNYFFYAIAVYLGGMQHSSQALPYTQNITSVGLTFVWFLFCIWWADISFYSSHWIFHNSPWMYRTVHKKHHEFQYQVAWSAEVKTITESIIVSITDLLPHLLFGGHLIHLLSWIIIGVLYNIEGHSGYSLLFLNTSFHDYHHTMNNGNYGIAFYLDNLFGTSKKFEDWLDAE